LSNSKIPNKVFNSNFEFQKVFFRKIFPKSPLGVVSIDFLHD
jgi:hypothetical protein